ncbi:MAG: hypothetical protein DRP99_02945 [Candidatus Latescibacterota bacterium]|nr:MAG: hypothetical protein DRP99_02945 [Candidatus Latescibacterota bacterium]
MLKRMSLVLLTATLGCWNPFAPDQERPPGGGEELSLEAPESTLEALDYAMNHKDIEWYDRVLDEDYWFREPNEYDDELDKGWGKEEDVEMVGKVFKYFDVFEYKLLGGRKYREFGSGTDLSKMEEGDVALTPEDPDDHPGEVWVVFSRPVDMYMYNYADDKGYKVNQLFEIKLRKGKDGLWRIVRWTDYPWNP